MKDVDDFSVLHPEAMARVLFPGGVEQHLVRKHDLIFRSRGQTYSAALVTENLGAAVVAAPLMVIRPHSSKVLPEYLRWFVNLPATHNVLASMAAGTSVKIINKAALQQLEVPVPALETQRKIARLGELMEEETKLMAEMTRLRHRLMEQTLLREARQGN
jgi:restriction endonuclease S subunit